jgi:hypothetical protein
MTAFPSCKVNQHPEPHSVTILPLTVTILPPYVLGFPSISLILVISFSVLAADGLEVVAFSDVFVSFKL